MPLPETLTLDIMQESTQPSTSGRKAQESVWTAIINFELQGKADAGEGEAKPGSKAARYIVDVLANCAEDSLPGRGPKRCSSAVFVYLWKSAPVTTRICSNVPALAKIFGHPGHPCRCM